jgi:hypothetical protein
MKNNDAGLGMVEILVAAGMIGGLSLAIMKMNESGLQGVGKVEKRMEIVGFDNEVNAYLGDSKACFNSLGPGMKVSAITGAGQVDFPRIRNKSNVDVFPLPFQRGVVKLNRVFLTDYQAATNSARIVKEYHYKSSPQRAEVKNQAGSVAISEASGEITGCFYRGSAAGNGPWIVETNYIYYDNGKVGVGTTAPTADLHVSKSGASPRLAVHNPEELPVFFELAGTGGVTGVEGFELEYANDGDTYFRNRWPTPNGRGNVYFQTATGGTPVNALTILQGGNVGVGTTSPATRLDVNGEIKLGNSGAACAAATEGQQRYNSTLKLMEFCNGTAWTPIGGGGLRIESGVNVAPDTCVGGSFASPPPPGGGFMCVTGLPGKAITFAQPFSSPPTVIVTLHGPAANVGAGFVPCTYGAMDQIGLSYDNVSKTGFVALAWMSPVTGTCAPYDSNVGPIAFSWYAIGQ